MIWFSPKESFISNMCECVCGSVVSLQTNRFMYMSGRCRSIKVFQVQPKANIKFKNDVVGWIVIAINGDQ